MDATRENNHYPEDMIHHIVSMLSFDDPGQLLSKNTFFKHQTGLCETTSADALLQQTERMLFWRHQRSTYTHQRFSEMQAALAKSRLSRHSDLMHKLFYLYLSCEKEVGPLPSIPATQQAINAQFLTTDYLTLLSFVSPKSLSELIKTLLLQETRAVWQILSEIPPKFFRKQRQEISQLVITELVAILTTKPSATTIKDDCLAKVLSTYWEGFSNSTFSSMEVLGNFILALSKKHQSTRHSDLRKIIMSIFTNLRQILAENVFKNVYPDLTVDIADMHEDAVSTPPQNPVEVVRTSEGLENFPQTLADMPILRLVDVLKHYLPYLNALEKTTAFQKLLYHWENAEEEEDKGILYPLIGKYCHIFDIPLQEKLYNTLEKHLLRLQGIIKHSVRLPGADELRNVLFLCCDILENQRVMSNKIAIMLAQFLEICMPHYPNLVQQALESLEGKMAKLPYQNLVLQFLTTLHLTSEHQAYHSMRYLKHLALQNYPRLQSAIEEKLCSLAASEGKNRRIILRTLLEIACVKGLHPQSITLVQDQIEHENDYFLKLAFMVLQTCTQKNKVALFKPKADMLGCAHSLC